MSDATTRDGGRSISVRNRRYCIRYPFAVEAVSLDLESGVRAEGITSDISLGGVFVCTSKALPVKSRIRITLKRKDEKIEALGVVRVVKPRIGMGIEFIDVESPYDEVLALWIEQLRKSR